MSLDVWSKILSGQGVCALVPHTQIEKLIAFAATIYHSYSWKTVIKVRLGIGLTGYFTHLATLFNLLQFKYRHFSIYVGLCSWERSPNVELVRHSYRPNGLAVPAQVRIVLCFISKLACINLTSSIHLHIGLF